MKGALFISYRTNKCQSNMFKYLEEIKFQIIIFFFYNINLLYENLLYVVQVHDLTIVNMHRILHLHLLLEDHLLLLNYKKSSLLNSVQFIILLINSTIFSAET